MGTNTGKNLKWVISAVAVLWFLSLMILIGQVIERNYPENSFAVIVLAISIIFLVLFVIAGAFYDAGKVEGVEEYKEREMDRKRRMMP